MYVHIFLNNCTCNSLFVLSFALCNYLTVTGTIILESHSNACMRLPLPVRIQIIQVLLQKLHPLKAYTGYYSNNYVAIPGDPFSADFCNNPMGSREILSRYFWQCFKRCHPPLAMYQLAFET